MNKKCATTDSRRRNFLSRMFLTKTLLSLFLSLCVVCSATSAQQTGVAPTSQQPAGAQASGAAQASSLAVRGLRDKVSVRRDARGVPYIEATNDADLFFAQGYVTASDRLWQMDLLRRTARGELSEIFGRTTLEEDKRRRVYGFAVLSEKILQRATPAARTALDAYARGVNAFIGTLDDKTLPAEFRLLKYRPRAWQPADSIVIGKIFSELLSTTWQTDVMRQAFADLPAAKKDWLFPVRSPLDVTVVGTDGQRKAARTSSASNSLASNSSRDGLSFHAPQPSRALSAVNDSLLRAAETVAQLDRASLERVGLWTQDRAVSNNWVVAGKRTATGKPLLASDPHLPASAPSIWYMTSLSAPGLRVAGVTAPGAPGIIIGHNEQIAWGVTNLGPDAQDLYAETFDASNTQRYRTPTGWRDATMRHEEIKVRKGFADESTDVVPVDVTVTRHGPIFLEQAGKRYSLQWAALSESSVEFEAFLRINRAHDWREFTDALKTYTGATQNFVYADRAGNIGYYGAGLIPIRRTGKGDVPYDGATDAGEWTGFIPFERLPHSYNPTPGVIATANARVVGNSYEYHLTDEWASPHRARRIYNLLTEKSKLSVEDFQRIQADTVPLSAQTFAVETAKLFGKELSRTRTGEATPEARASFARTLEIFSAWDGRAEPESSAMPRVVEMRRAFLNRILIHAVGRERAALYRWSAADTFTDRLITERPAAWLPAEFKSYEDLLLACEGDMRAALTKRIGADETQWTWGRYAQMRITHPLAALPFVGKQFQIEPLPARGTGSPASVNVGAGVSMRFIADLSDWNNSRLSITHGESGDAASPHWTDQLSEWYEARPRPFPFSTDAVVRESRTTLMLIPLN